MPRMDDATTTCTRALARWVVTAMLAFACAPLAAQPRYGLSAEAYAVFSRWMSASCIGDEAQALQQALLRHRVELAPAFRQALADGPPAGTLRDIRAAAEARAVALARFPVAEYRIEGVSPQALAQYRRKSRADYAADQVQRYTTGYRSNAVAGLGIVGGPDVRTTLARLASRRTDPLAPAAAEAIKAMDRR
ncbi:MAG: hypothetical protein ABI624_06360 [Casimicrobiaceae bacterium]